MMNYEKMSVAASVPAQDDILRKTHGVDRRRVKAINYLKKFAGIIMIVLMAVSVVGCSDGKRASGSLKSEDGRSYGGLVEGEMGKKVSTVFFDMTVDSAKKQSVYQFDDGLYQADEGNTYLVVTITISNRYDKDLPMSIADFTLDFAGNDSNDVITGFGTVRLKDDKFMDNIYTLKRGESITKSILFTVPDKAEYFLCYKEYYEDKFEGDSYEISMVPTSDENENVIDASSQENVEASKPQETDTQSPEGDTQSQEGGTQSPEGDTQSQEGGTQSPEGDTQSQEGGTQSQEGDTQSQEGDTQSQESDTQSPEEGNDADAQDGE